MKHSLAKALAQAGYPQPEAPRYPQRWCVKFGDKSKSTFKINDDKSRILVVEKRIHGQAFYVPTVDEMLRALNALYGGTEEFNLSYFDGMATCSWDGSDRSIKYARNAKEALAYMWIDLSSEKTPHLREELIRVTTLSQNGHVFRDRASAVEFEDDQRPYSVSGNTLDIPSLNSNLTPNDGE